MSTDGRPPDESPDQPETPTDNESVEGHSMLNLELHRQIATSRSREAADWAASERARRRAHEDRKRR